MQAVGVATSFLEAEVGGGYYDAQYNYEMGYAPVWRQTRMLWHYATSPVAAPIGRGFDRWWLLLAKAGVSQGTLWAIGTVEFAGFAIAGWVLWRCWRQSERPQEILAPAQPAVAD